MSTSTSLRTHRINVLIQYRLPARRPRRPRLRPGRDRPALRSARPSRELLDLVASRAFDEADVNGNRIKQDAKVDAEYPRPVGARRQIRDASTARRGDDEKRRQRRSLMTAMTGEGQAKAEFASASRQIAADFDTLRETAEAELNRARKRRRQPGSRPATGKRPPGIPQAMKPMRRPQIADGFRHRLAALADDYAQVQAQARASWPARETYTKFEKPDDEVFDRLAKMEPALRILEGLIIPKSLKGAAKPGRSSSSLARLRGHRDSCWDSRHPRWPGWPSPALALGGLLRTWLVKLPQRSLSGCTTRCASRWPTLDGLNAHCKALADARLPRNGSGWPRDEELEAGQGEPRQGPSPTARNGPRRASAADQRDLRPADGRGPDQPGQRDARGRHATTTRQMAEIPAESERNLAKLDDDYKTLKEQITDRYENEMDGPGRPLARGDEARDRRARQVSQGGRPDWPGLGRSVLGRLAAAQARSARRPLRHGSRCDLAALPQGSRADPRLMEGIPRRFDLPALRPFPAAANLLIETPAEGRTAALAVLQASMFRLLTSLPPGHGPVHDRRPDRHRPQLRRLHAPGRLRPGARRPTRSGPTPARSRNGWPSWQPTWRR